MAAPDRDLEQALRRALSAAVGGVEPGADGLERIRARTGRHPPQPWLLSIGSAAIERARGWFLRGRLAWPAPRLSPRHARPRPPTAPRLGSAIVAGANWVRPVAVLSGIAFIAAISLALPPLRQAIVQVSSTVLTGGQASDILGNGGGTVAGSGSPLPSQGQAGNGQSPGAGTPGTQCQPTASASRLPGSADSSPAPILSQAAVRVSPTVAPSTRCPSPTATSAPVTQKSGTASPTSAPPTSGAATSPTPSATTPPATASPTATPDPSPASPSAGATPTEPDSGTTTQPSTPTSQASVGTSQASPSASG